MKVAEWVERLLETRDDPMPEHADVVIGIGTDVSRNGKNVSSQSKAIVEKCLEIFLSGRVEYILFTGGYYTTTETIDITGIALSEEPPFTTKFTEAYCMSNYLLSLVIEKKLNAGMFRGHRILHEIESFRTFLNADYTLPLIREKGWKSVVIATQQWHARRVRKTFKKRWEGSGIKFVVVKARSPYSGDNSQWRWRGFWRYLLCWEIPVWFYSKLKGYC